MSRASDLRHGVRVAAPILLPTVVLGISFGVLARPVMGTVAPVVMSLVVLAGGAQFAALGVLQTGGAFGAAVSAGLLVNARWLPMGFALAPSLRGGRLRRAAEAQALLDPSFVLADRGGGRFDPRILIGATLPQAAAWVLGTLVGVLASDALPAPGHLGLDAMFPAFYMTLLLNELGDRRAVTTAALAGVLTLALMPIAPPGVPVVAAAAAALLGLRR